MRIKLSIMFFTIIILSDFISLLSAAEKIEEVYFRFPLSDKNNISDYQPVIALDKIEDNFAYAYATEKQFAGILEKKLKVEILTNPSKIYNYRMATTREEMRNWDYYPTYEVYVEMMYQFQTDYPELCTVYSLGSTVDNREILVAKISDNVTVNEAEPEFFYTATIHGDETTGYILTLRMIDHLLSNYGIEDELTEIIDGMEIWINPLANPDGTYHSGNHTVWGATRSNANGVDLNRNFKDPEDGDHPDGNPWQPETIIMMNFADSQNLIMSANYHGGAEVVNYPWDTWEMLHADDDWYQMVSHLYANLCQENSPNNYMNEFNDGITNGYAWYSIDGGRQDYMNYFARCREITLEISDVKTVQESELVPHWNYNRDAMIAYMKQAMFGLRGIVSDENGNPLEAMITVENYDFNNSEAVTCPEVGDYYRMLMPGSYTITASAFGYTPVTVEDVVITENEITELSFVLTESFFTVNGVITDEDNLPVPGVLVSLNHEMIQNVVTDDEGSFVFPIVSEGSYLLSALIENFVPFYENVDLSDSTFFSIRLRMPYFKEDFENEPLTGWILDSIWGVQLQQDNHFLTDSPNGNYSDNMNASATLFEPIDLSDAVQAHIYFDISYELEADYDYAYFEVSTDSDTWITVDSYNGSADWYLANYDMNNYIGGLFYLRFRINTDGYVTRDGIKIDNIVIDAPDEVGSYDQVEPEVMLISQSYPNPFITSKSKDVNFSVSLPKSINSAVLVIYNIKGQQIKKLAISDAKSGIRWDGSDSNGRKCGSGVYFYKVESGKFSSEVKKMLILH